MNHTLGNTDSAHAHHLIDEKIRIHRHCMTYSKHDTGKWKLAVEPKHSDSLTIAFPIKDAK